MVFDFIQNEHDFLYDLREVLSLLDSLVDDEVADEIREVDELLPESPVCLLEKVFFDHSSAVLQYELKHLLLLFLRLFILLFSLALAQVFLLVFDQGKLYEFADSEQYQSLVV